MTDTRAAETYDAELNLMRTLGELVYIISSYVDLDLAVQEGKITPDEFQENLAEFMLVPVVLSYDLLSESGEVLSPWIRLAEDTFKQVREDFKGDLDDDH